MGTVIEPHTTPKAPEGRDRDWHGTAEADETDETIQIGGWDALANAHAWYDPDADPEHDPPHEKQAYELPHHEEVGGRVRGVYRHLVRHYEESEKDPPALDDARS